MKEYPCHPNQGGDVIDDVTQQPKGMKRESACQNPGFYWPVTLMSWLR